MPGAQQLAAVEVVEHWRGRLDPDGDPASGEDLFAAKTMCWPSETLPSPSTARSTSRHRPRSAAAAKTVSVHTSNMLRKTGTANRVELTRLANRLRAVI